MKSGTGSMEPSEIQLRTDLETGDLNNKTTVRLEEVAKFGDILQLVIVELIYKVCHHSPTERSKFIRCIYNLLASNSSAVRYEAAGTLVTLSTAPSAIKAAATCYIELTIKESDINVKLIVLERLSQLCEVTAHKKVLEDRVMDILRILTAPDLEVRRITLNLALDLLTTRTVNEAVMFLRKEVERTHNSVEHDETGKYRQLLVRTLLQCCVKFPEVAPSIVPVLAEFLSDQNELAATDVLVFMREAVQKFPALVPVIVEKLQAVFSSIRSGKVIRSTIWILGEFAREKEDVEAVVALVKQCLGEFPLVETELQKAGLLDGELQSENKVKKEEAPPKPRVERSQESRLVTSDGIYSAQFAFSMQLISSKDESIPSLRKIFKDGDFFVGAALASSLTKMIRRLFEDKIGKTSERNKLSAEAETARKTESDSDAEDFLPTPLERNTLTMNMSTRANRKCTTDVDDKTKVCSHCPYSTNDSSNFRKHMRRMHENRSDSSTATLKCPENEVPFTASKRTTITVVSDGYRTAKQNTWGDITNALLAQDDDLRRKDLTPQVDPCTISLVPGLPRFGSQAKYGRTISDEEKSPHYEKHCKNIITMTLENMVNQYMAIRPKLQDIFEGNVENKRANAYLQGPSGRKTLQHLSVSIPFQHDQTTVIIDRLLEYFIPNALERPSWVNYITGVILPEALIHIYARVNNISIETSDLEMRFQGYTNMTPTMKFPAKLQGNESRIHPEQQDSPVGDMLSLDV